MVDYITSRPFGLVFIVTAHVVFDGHSQAEVTGALGRDIILRFTFDNITDIASVGLYRVDRSHTEKKIHECSRHDNCSESHVCVFNAASAFYCIANLRRNNSGSYFVSVFMTTGPGMVKSEPVSLAVRQENTSSTVPPTPTNSTSIDGNGSGSFSPQEFPFYCLLIFVFLGVSVVALSAGSLFWFVRRHKTTKEQQQQDPTPTAQETAEASGHVPAPSLVYSVLDFPKRPQGGVEVQLTDTEYAAITYPPKQGQV